MIDAVTKKPMRLERRDFGAFLNLPDSQVADVQRVLDERGVGNYWVHESRISLDGEPYMAFIQFSRYADHDAAQAALDAN